MYLGQKLPICEIVDINLKQEEFKLTQNSLNLYLKTPLTEEKKVYVRRSFYKYYAPKILLNRVEYFANLMNLHPKKVSFRKAKTRWGSCSSVNNISLNIGLLMLSNELIDYVVVHELAHIKHKNHFKEFWNMVEKYYQSYKQAKEELKKYSLLLKF